MGPIDNFEILGFVNIATVSIRLAFVVYLQHAVLFRCTIAHRSGTGHFFLSLHWD
jgi:hypothetical protein